MPTNYFPNGFQIIGALTFSAQLTEAITRLSSGEVIWVNQPGDPDQTTEMMRWDPTTGQLRMQGIDGENVSFIIPRFTAANLPAAGVPGRMAYTTDDNLFRLDNGTAWLQVSPISIPLAVASGGTGATTAAGARTNLAVASTAHEATHISGGSDPFISTDLIEALIKRIRESGGADLLVGAVADGELLQRSGTDLIGVPVPPPAGIFTPYGGTSAPTGWLLCDGQAVNRTTFATLFAVIGTAYGVGDGSTTFNVPNMKGRIPVGLDAAQTEFDALAEVGGAKTHTLTTAEMPVHNHGTFRRTAGGPWGTPGGATAVDVTQNAGGGGAHANLQPYIVCNYIIKT